MENITGEESKLIKALIDMKGKGNLNDLIEQTALNNSAAMRATLNLSAMNCLKLERIEFSVFRLSEEGERYAEEGLPEHRLVEAIIEMGGKASITQANESAKVDQRILPIALGWIKKKRLGTITKINEELFIEAPKPTETSVDQKALTQLKEESQLNSREVESHLLKALKTLKKRNLVLEESKSEWILTLTKKGYSTAESAVAVLKEKSQLAPEDIATGRWRRIKLRKYNIQAPVTITWPGKKHPYNQFLDELRNKLTSLGFKEMDGPIAEIMFFNCDALFMPQDHPAREIHDIFFIKNPKYGEVDKYKRYLENVKKTHEDGWTTGSIGWRYSFSTEQSKRMILRSHGTAISARTLVNPKLEIPGKYFSVARCYRPEITDKTHLSEFNQVEGIVVGEGLTLRDLLGILERFALDIAEADKVRFKPDYFPFTEPSVELQAYKEGYGWMEFGGSGIFRPELTKPLGINCQVIAWGLGVDRLYMMKSNLDDIRGIFTRDLSWLRNKEVT